MHVHVLCIRGLKHEGITKLLAMLAITPNIFKMLTATVYQQHELPTILLFLNA